MEAKWKFSGVVVKAVSGSLNWFQTSNLIVSLKFVSFRILFFFSFDYSLPKDLIDSFFFFPFLISYIITKFVVSIDFGHSSYPRFALFQIFG